MQATAPATPPVQAHTVAPLSMVALSPDGKYLAGVASDGNTVSLWAAGATKPYSTLSLPGVTAISWDRRDYLWVAQGSTTTMVLQTSNSGNHSQITNGFPPDGKILDLSVAPDGVRVAAIVRAVSGPVVDLAAINSGKPGSGLVGQPVPAHVHRLDRPARAEHPQPDRADLVRRRRLARARRRGDKTSLWEVPVDGQLATSCPVCSPARSPSPPTAPGTPWWSG